MQNEGPGRRDRPRPARTLPEKVADSLGTAITEGTLAAGERLVEQEIAARFAVSRGPVREAFRILAQRGLAVITPRRGVRVAALSLDALVDLFNMRAVLMGLAARYFALMADDAARRFLAEDVAAVDAAGHADDGDSASFIGATARVSRLIARRCGSEELAHLIDHQNHRSAWTTLWQSGRIDFTTRERRLTAAALYVELGDAVGARDGARAESVMRRMIMLSRESVVAAVARTLDPGFDERRLLVA